MRLCKVRLFRLLRSALLQKSSRDKYGPLSLRSLTIGLIAPSPRVFIADRPKRIDLFAPGISSIQKNSSERLTSGRSMGMSSFMASLIALSILSGLSNLEFNTEAMYSTG